MTNQKLHSINGARLYTFAQDLWSEIGCYVIFNTKIM